jgi:alpha-tubulin suppressor-like RCC1 family protein
MVVSCAVGLTVAVTEQGQLFTWGSRECVLGRVPNEKDLGQMLPTLVDGLEIDGAHFIMDDTGQDFAAALASDGTVLRATIFGAPRATVSIS